MNILITLLAACASIACLFIVAMDIYYEEPTTDAPDYMHNAVGMLISVGSLSLPAMALKLIIDLF